MARKIGSLRQRRIPPREIAVIAEQVKLSFRIACLAMNLSNTRLSFSAARRGQRACAAREVSEQEGLNHELTYYTTFGRVDMDARIPVGLVLATLSNSSIASTVDNGLKTLRSTHSDEFHRRSSSLP